MPKPVDRTIANDISQPIVQEHNSATRATATNTAIAKAIMQYEYSKTSNWTSP